METRRRGRRVSQRQPRCCTECTRRKLRCSKVIPCSSCLDRGSGHLCKRENVDIRRRTSANLKNYAVASQLESAEASSEPEQLPNDSPQVSESQDRNTAIEGQDETYCEGNQSFETSQNTISLPLVDGVTQDAAVTLEFLALSRQRIMQIGQESRAVSSGTPQHQPATIIDPIISASKARSLVKYHEENIAWLHHVIHAPTFRQECESFFETGQVVNPFWLALYYSILSVTLSLTPVYVLALYDIFEPNELSEKLYRKSIEALHSSNFMATHSVTSIQTICVLIYLGHNLGESDFIATILGSAIRIAQSLGLHRIGSGESFGSAEDPEEINRQLIDREVRKRVWWFLIRQDWLQIPFMNTYTIHATQFNTPMPTLCHEGIEQMIEDRKVSAQNANVYTQGSYTHVLNRVSVLIWKTQDRMCGRGHPGKSPDGLKRLYEEVILADSELKTIMKTMPVFYRDNSLGSSGLPPHIAQQRQILLLSMFHKFYTIHRHFQVLSFKDPWFSFTKISCLPIARRSLRGLFALPDDQYTWAAKNIWTTSTQIVAAAISLMFEELFAADDESKMLDSEEIQDLARQCSQSLQKVCDKSEIARKGVRIIDFLLNLAGDGREHGPFDLDKIIAHVKEDALAHTDVHSNLEEIDLFSYIDWPSPGVSGLRNWVD